MTQYIIPDMVGTATYRKAEACMTNNAKRIIGWDWYQTARPLGIAPTMKEMRDYGRECALAYILEGHPEREAYQLATRHMYQRAYDDIRGYVRHTGGDRDRVEATTSIVSTQTFHTPYEANNLWAWQDHRWFELCDAIARLDLNQQEKKILVLLAAGWTKKETAEEVGLKRTTLVMRIPRIAEKIGAAWRTIVSSN